MKQYSIFVAVLFLLARPLASADTADTDTEAKRGLTILQHYITGTNYKTLD